MGRLIGIRHRVKKTAGGESRPTSVTIKEAETTRTLDLETDDDELDFVWRRYPVAYREIEPEEDFSKVLLHHLKKRRRPGAADEYITRVPSQFDGLKRDDRVIMILGGSGDRFAYALSRRGQDIGAEVWRTTPAVLKQFREKIRADKDNDHLTIIQLFEEEPKKFYLITPRDRDFIFMRESFRSWHDSQKDRIRCQVRLRRMAVGQVFLSQEGLYPEGSIKDAFDALKASDKRLENLENEEAEKEIKLRKAVRQLDVWQEIFKPLEGLGELLAGRLLTDICDILRFYRPGWDAQKQRRVAWRERAAGFKHFMGVHVEPDGAFPRRRRGERAHWSNNGRQAFWLLVDQFVRRKDSLWGQKFLEIKANLTDRHREPEEMEVLDSKTGKPKKVKKYTRLHLHKMTIWRCATRIAEWIYREWTRLEFKKVNSGPPSH